MEKTELVGATIQFSGIVQGVGFRPFVYRKAHLFHLKGSVKNTEQGVIIRVDGDRKVIKGFYQAILKEPPFLADIDRGSISFHDPSGFDEFVIEESSNRREGYTPLSPDIATCSECLSEVFETRDRRYRYPFTNCTNCGPRFTIIRSIPYDRVNTTMSSFTMCQQCLDEYTNPLDRRYHAQPNACPECGPGLRLLSAEGREIDKDPVEGAVSALRHGMIVAVKGLGGYHLAVDACNDKAVRLLREKKRRPAKPFALMVRSLEVAKKYCRIQKKGQDLLTTFARPIVLFPKTGTAELSPRLAPDTPMLGIMLPYTPLHHILMEEGPEVLVMTSANISEEPLVFRDDDAFSTLRDIADAFLIHNREIQRPCDDSVMSVVQGDGRFIRRSRGFVPRSIELKKRKAQILATGASEKNTFCLCKDGKAFLSHHIGDLNNEKSLDAYIRGIEDFLRMFRVNPEAVACDAHPDYLSSLYALEFSQRKGLPLFRIQHHHAHIAAVLGEHNISEDIIGIAFDGTGYGPDDTIWGGEFLVANRGEYTRTGHFAPVPMPGGEKSIVEIDRMAVSYLIEAYGSLDKVPDFRFFDTPERERFFLIERMIAGGINCPLSSSCGRLFDAVSALIGLCSRPTYHAQGAILLETEAHDIDYHHLPAPYGSTIDGGGGVHFDAMIREIVQDLRNGISTRTISQRFHWTIVQATVEMCERIKIRSGIRTVALSGGVFQNRLLLEHCTLRLERHGFRVLNHTLVPPNDGGISFGQTVVALNRLKRGEDGCV